MAKTWDTKMQERFDSFEHKVERVEQKVESLSMKSDMQFEKLQADIQTLGEGYDEGLKGISRQIGDLARTWDAKWSPRDLALTDHGKRITALERRRQ